MFELLVSGVALALELCPVIAFAPENAVETLLSIPQLAILFDSNINQICRIKLNDFTYTPLCMPD